MRQHRHYLGTISGTSVDGIDVALIRVDANDGITLVGGQTVPFDPGLEATLRTLIAAGQTSLATLGRADTLLGEALADACLQLLADCDVAASDVSAIGSHGQTIWHDADSAVPCTLQIGDPNVIAERTGIAVVGDFRRRDLAAGGQAAPLVPPFHAAVFASASEPRVVVNLGGIANLTLLDGDVAGVLRDAPGAAGSIRGFDSGPANALLDAWYRQHHDAGFDRDGAWARSGQVSAPLLNAFLGESFFARLPPKSTGKETFHLRWIEQALRSVPDRVAARDVQATLAELTATTVAQAVHEHAPAAGRIILCGGGVHNRYLCERLAARLPALPTDSAASFGIDPDLVEAAAFAWLAHRRLRGLPGAFASVTGAAGNRVIGGLFAGRQRPPDRRRGD